MTSADLTAEQKAARFELLKKRTPIVYVGIAAARAEAAIEATADHEDDDEPGEDESVDGIRERVGRELDAGRGASNREDYEEASVDDAQITVRDAVLEGHG
jgi:hypothetical protein